jgi:glucokinase
VKVNLAVGCDIGGTNCKTGKVDYAVGCDIGGTNYKTGKVTLAVGCDIGGTNYKTGLIDSTGNILEHRSFPVDHEAGVETFLKKLFDTIGGVTKGRQVRGIGVLLPGYLRNNRRVPRIMVNIPMLEGVPLYDLLAERFNTNIALDIDRNGPCLAEYLFHYREKVSRLMYVTLGTGVGVGLVIDGEIARFTNDSIGELGHLTLEPDSFHCACGNRGCVETVVSIRGIIRIAERLGVLEHLKVGSSESFHPGEIYNLAVKGDRNTHRVFREFERLLGASLVTFANTFSPDLIVIGGGLSGGAEFFLETAENYLNEHWFERSYKRIPVVTSSFGPHAGIVGAAALVLV